MLDLESLLDPHIVFFIFINLIFSIVGATLLTKEYQEMTEMSSFHDKQVGLGYNEIKVIIKLFVEV